MLPGLILALLITGNCPELNLTVLTEDPHVKGLLILNISPAIEWDSVSMIKNTNFSRN